MGQRLRLLLVAAVTAAVLAPAGTAATRDGFPLHAGSSGTRVAALQWLLAGHRPNVFAQVKPTFNRRPNGSYGARTKHAVLAYKYRIGYPAKGDCGAKTTLLRDTTGRYFFYILEGKAKRPICWVALAALRVKGAVRTGASQTALAIKGLLLRQVGVHEVPDGSNRGPCISTSCAMNTAVGFGPYQASTGAFGAPWCASLEQWALAAVTGRIYPAALPAYVPSIAEYAQAHNEISAKPRVGSWVIFLSSDLQLVNAYHVGFVMKVTASGLTTFEGNYSNRAGEVWRPFVGNRMVYVNVPGVA